MIFRVREVLNYGGFFAGDTVTVTAHAVATPDVEVTLTIDQGALTNLDDRFQIVAGMALEVQLEGEHVVSATLAAVPERAALRTAVKFNGAKEQAVAAQSLSPDAGSKAPAPMRTLGGSPAEGSPSDPGRRGAGAGSALSRSGADTAPTPADGSRIFSHFCAKCNLWILGAPRDGKCGVEGHDL